MHLDFLIFCVIHVLNYFFNAHLHPQMGSRRLQMLFSENLYKISQKFKQLKMEAYTIYIVYFKYDENHYIQHYKSPRDVFQKKNEILNENYKSLESFVRIKSLCRAMAWIKMVFVIFLMLFCVFHSFTNIWSRLKIFFRWSFFLQLWLT